MATRYKMRINVRTLKNGNMYAYVAMSDDTVALFDKPYVSVKRMQDRLAFCPWDTKTGQGMVAIGDNGRLQIGKQEDCEKMLDFCGQYYLVNKTDSGVVYVKLADRHPFDREVGEYNSSPHDKCSEIIVDCSELVVNGDKPAMPSLKELLGKKIEKGEERLKEIRAEIERLTKEYIEPMQEKADKLNDEIRAYCEAYNYMKDGE